jgi:ADP-ribose pyrophosphatase YjhB (NUDIX family)
VAVRDGEILLVRRGRSPGWGQWSIPGGRVEWGETLEGAVIREVAEETGLEVSCGGFIGYVEVIEPASHFVILDFWVEPVADQPLVAGDDAAEVSWVPLTDLASVDLVDGLLDFLVVHGIAPATT